MKVQVLIDNIAGTSGSRKLFGEWGLSVYVEFEDKRYLLDTGASHLFAKNAGVMGVDLSKVDIGILSHAHFDHSDGMAKFFALNKIAPFYLRKGAGENCYHAHKLIGRFTYHEYIGIHKGFLKRFADRIRFAEGDMQIAPNVYLVPHKTPGLSAIGERAHLSVKENGKYRYDSFDHEQSLVTRTCSQVVHVVEIVPHLGIIGFQGSLADSILQISQGLGVKDTLLEFRVGAQTHGAQVSGAHAQHPGVQQAR